MDFIPIFWNFLAGLVVGGYFNWLVVGPVILLLVVLAMIDRAGIARVGSFVWSAVWLGALWIIFKFGFQTPVPQSVINIYMGISALAVGAYVSSSSDRAASFVAPVRKLVTDHRLIPLLVLILLAIPAAVAANVYMKMNVPLEAPSFGRTVHPSPPDSIVVGESTIDLRTADNPFRHLRQDDPEEYARRVASGRETYYLNCFFCHGDDMYGDGMFAHGLNPIPSNFQVKGTLDNFQESFFFWRIAKGAPGMPEEGGPWDSAMPVWERFLSEEEIWEVILFLYDFTGYEPRALSEEVHH